MRWTPGRLDRLAMFQNNVMNHQCQLHEPQITQNRYNKPERRTYKTPVDSICGYDATGGDEIMNGAEVIITDAAIRLPSGTVIGPDWGITVIGITGMPDFDPPVRLLVIGPPESGPSAIVVNCKSMLTNDF